MVKVDLLISVGIWVTGVGMSAVGIEMTINPPSDKTKWWYRAAFIVMGIAFVGLGVWQFDRTDKETKRLAADHQQEQLRNEGDIKYMQGQLDTQNKLLAGVVANSDPKQLAALLRGSATDKSTLKKRTIVLCSDIEAWAKKQSPPPSTAIPGKPTQKEQEDQNAFFQKQMNEYYQRFGARALSIVQEYGGKGIVDVRTIEIQAESGYLPNDLVVRLRAFANRINDDGTLKQ
jgi:hypothetical protein